MRILFITHKFYPDMGGIEVNSEILAGEFQKAGHEVHLVTWTVDTGNKIFPYKVIRGPKKIQLLKEHLWANVVFENNPSIRLSWPVLILNKKSVVALRTWITRIDGEIGWQDKFKQFWLRRASAVIAVSEAVRKKSWPNAVVIGNPYRSELFKIITDIKKDRGFVFMGRLVSDKGADFAIKAWFALFKEKINTTSISNSYSLTIVGDGPEKNGLEEMVSTLGINQYVKFTGALKGMELVNCLNQHQFLLVPSMWEEPFGNVALEGMACGCIPIVSDGGGLPDAVGNAGMVFRRGDLEDLISKMDSLISDPEVCKSLRLNAREHLINHLPEKVAGRYLKLITDALS